MPVRNSLKNPLVLNCCPYWKQNVVRWHPHRPILMAATAEFSVTRGLIGNSLKMSETTDINQTLVKYSLDGSHLKFYPASHRSAKM